MSAARKLHLPPSHPLECYAREDWQGSPVVPFPVTANRRALAQVAVGIARGKRGGGIAKAVDAERMRLFLSQVPRAIAEAEIAEYQRELSALVAEAQRRLAEGTNG